jgi:MoaA/NifB/PqqE/SkfB family radical SAM enzyme
VDAGSRVGVRVTLQRANYRELPAFVELTRRLGAHSVSFLAVDVANPHAFGRTEDFGSDLALAPEDLEPFAQLLSVVERQFASQFRSGFIAESPAKLRRIHQYFAALHGRGAYPPVNCNAPEFSAVIGVRGEVRPCFFIPGPTDAAAQESDLADSINAGSMTALRADIRAGERTECGTCVCSLYRDLDTVEASLLP